MAHSKQAQKRIRQNERARLRNKARKAVLRTYVKRTVVAVEQRNLELAKSLLPAAMKKLDKAAKCFTIHPNTASRQKARLARQIARLEKELAASS